MSLSKKEKLKVLSVDPVQYRCPRCGSLLMEKIGMNFDENFGKIIAYCTNDSFQMNLELSRYGLIPEGYLQNIEKGILDRSEGWYERWDLKDMKNGWLLKPKKKK